MNTSTTDKEVLHTGELYVGNGSALQSLIFAHDKYGLRITVETEYYHEDNEYHLQFAELICKAVNERQKLLEINRELLEALEEWQRAVERFIDITATGQRRNTLCDTNIKMTQAINNAKNIQ